MRSFMYLIEIILVGLLLISYLYYVKVPTDIEKTLSLFEKKYQLDTLIISTINLIKPDFEDLFKISYLIYSEKLKDFSQNLERLDILNIDINNLDCVAFLYPFPILDTHSYYSKDHANFFIYSIDGKLCRNFTISNDWKIIKIDNLPSTNISLSLEKSLNLSLLDPYSIFVFDDFGNELKIDEISYDSSYLNITNIYFNSNINKLPIYIFLRIKESSNIENLSYLSGRYSISNYIPGTELSFSLGKSNWLTIYLIDECVLKKTLIIKYSIFPSPKLKTPLLTNFQKEACKGNYNITYFKDLLFEKYNELELAKLNVVSDPIRSEHEAIIYVINGLNLALLKIYGS